MDYTYPSIYFAYTFFALMCALALFFLIRTIRDGYWSEDGEAVKYHVFADNGDKHHER